MISSLIAAGLGDLTSTNKDLGGDSKLFAAFANPRFHNMVSNFKAYHLFKSIPPHPASYESFPHEQAVLVDAKREYRS